MMANQAGNQMVQYSATSSGAVTPGAAGDEVRVDCCLMATDGRSVVTGSSLGPPQVWDMQVIQQACKTMQASSAEYVFSVEFERSIYFFTGLSLSPRRIFRVWNKKEYYKV